VEFLPALFFSYNPPEPLKENTMFEQTRYKRNYLSEVVARIDLLNPIEGITTALPKELSKRIKKNFPIAEPRKTTIQELQISLGEGVTSKETETTQWDFHGKNRDKRLTIVPNAIFVRYTSYESFESLKSDFLDIVAVFFERFKDMQGTRSGLRYVNNIVLDEGKPLVWDEYLNDKLLGLFQFHPNPEYLARVFHNMEFNFGDSNLRFQFGMYNPDYPAVIRRKAFVLDFDAYYQGIQDQEEIFANFDKFHENIQGTFEMSITETFRRKLNDTK
jgi:uncharacterized protein (TIGR04255 family)